ncbi:Helix-turn-helix domain-containing protein [Tangfeifania diversioriginum]|uniref:Helix-turn-helix domain-containing protein n=1 Tax=Tangfeifania diversioriginum TaxID=1168035 RepID=A0A1M6H4D1_9BACT|nr:helix-turn-helix domain-containing protein [Tangfeifania diversioriginum]SHJ17045.1 Helix-turn-helix domain-containing protein [Tangfeifania diversioriginum]
MNLTELLENPANSLRLEVNGEALQDFAVQIAERTANRIIKEIQTPDDPISEKEVCTMFGKTRQTLSKYRKCGKLRYHRIGREIYYFPKELKEDMANF